MQFNFPITKILIITISVLVVMAFGFSMYEDSDVWFLRTLHWITANGITAFVILFFVGLIILILNKVFKWWK